jgi:hypothetical protein
VTGASPGPRALDRALLAPGDQAAPRFLVCAPVHVPPYPAFPDEVWLCDAGGMTLEAARAVMARGGGGDWVLAIERVEVTGEAWPSSDHPAVTEYLLRAGTWVVLVPSATLVPRWVSPEARLIVRVAHAGEDEAAARAALAREPARALLGRVRALESVEAGPVVRWLQKTATALGGGWG